MLIGILLLVLGNVLGVEGTVATLPLYQVVGVPFPAGIRAVLDTAWAIMLAWLDVALLRRQRRAFAWVGPLLTIYALLGLGWQAAFVRADYGRGRFPFELLLTVLALVPVWWIVLRRRWLTP